MVGQISGLAFTAGMSVGWPSVMGWWLGAFAVTMAVMAGLALNLKESPAVRNS